MPFRDWTEDWNHSRKLPGKDGEAKAEKMAGKGRQLYAGVYSRLLFISAGSGASNRLPAAGYLTPRDGSIFCKNTVAFSINI